MPYVDGMSLINPWTRYC